MISPRSRQHNGGCRGLHDRIHPPVLGACTHFTRFRGFLGHGLYARYEDAKYLLRRALDLLEACQQERDAATEMARLLPALISWALASPSNPASEQTRDTIVTQARAALAAYDAARREEPVDERT